MALAIAPWRITVLSSLLLLVSSPAFAYGDLFVFNDAVETGGGGGRWFTGSPADSYDCTVCHAGGATAGVLVQGLPERYQPGATYDIYIDWVVLRRQAVAVAELTDERGLGAGTAAVAASVPPAAESCVPADMAVPAAIVLDAADLGLEGGRQIVGLQDCGATRLHFQWTAPLQAQGTLFFSGGLVQGDERDDAAGDLVTVLFRPLLSPSQAQYEHLVASGCSALPAAVHARSRSSLLWLWLALIAIRIRAHR